jgi:hypothetical protein
MSLETAWGRHMARCDRCGVVLSRWEIFVLDALREAAHQGATVRENANGGAIIYCAACAAQIGQVWLDSLARPRGMEGGQ